MSEIKDQFIKSEKHMIKKNKRLEEQLKINLKRRKIQAQNRLNLKENK